MIIHPIQLSYIHNKLDDYLTDDTINTKEALIHTLLGCISVFQTISIYQTENADQLLDMLAQHYVPIVEGFKRDLVDRIYTYMCIRMFKNELLRHIFLVTDQQLKTSLVLFMDKFKTPFTTFHSKMSLLPKHTRLDVYVSIEDMFFSRDGLYALTNHIPLDDNPKKLLVNKLLTYMYLIKNGEDPDPTLHDFIYDALNKMDDQEFVDLMHEVIFILKHEHGGNRDCVTRLFNYIDVEE